MFRVPGAARCCTAECLGESHHLMAFLLGNPMESTEFQSFICLGSLQNHTTAGHAFAKFPNVSLFGGQKKSLKSSWSRYWFHSTADRNRAHHGSIVDIIGEESWHGKGLWIHVIVCFLHKKTCRNFYMKADSEDSPNHLFSNSWFQ